jgi:uncharacterized iron-regulated protein
LPIYYDNWKIPWPFYREIFLFARDKKIPLVGLNVPRKITNKVVRKGVDHLTKQEIGNLPPGLSCDVDSAYMEFIRRAYSAHDYQNNFLNFCEAQIVWDSAMAFYAVDFIRKNPEYTMLILAGTGHAWKRAIPERMKKLHGDSYSTSVVLPEISGKTERDKIDIDDSDYLILEQSQHNKGGESDV